MTLTEKYRKVLDLVGKLPIEGLNVEEKGGKMYVTGTAPYQLEKDLVWDAIKANPSWETDLSADIKVKNTEFYGYWTVQSGDSLSKIAKKTYDDGNKYAMIFEANKDQLKDPNSIKPGQKLKIPNP